MCVSFKKERSCGVLMHISSLPSEFGIGSLGSEAFKFVNFLNEAGLKVWQMLPICPVDETGSPYCSVSAFAGNPLLIDLTLLEQEGLVNLVEFDELEWGTNEVAVQFDVVRKNKEQVLRAAFKNWLKKNNKSILHNFAKINQWAHSYAVFQVLSSEFEGQPWWNWPHDFKFRNKNTLEAFESTHEEAILFYLFEQLVFFQQWGCLKQHAKNQGVNLMGDLPIYVSQNSVDVWVNPENFCLDSDLMPKVVAGCPPDAFSEEGQLWGNPIYDWGKMQQNGYSWWTQRFKSCCGLFDFVRIDHFRGFESFYCIEFGRTNTKDGVWIKGPGFNFFEAVQQKIGKLNLIAEDLGFLTDETRALLKQTGFPGMEVLQLSFDTREKNSYLPHFYDYNSVCYTGTHDNNTAVGWFNEIGEELRNHCKQYLNFTNEPVNWALIRAAMASVCKLAIIPMQDFLGLDETFRMNTPGTTKNNWRWRLAKNQFPKADLILKIRNMVQLYER